MPLAISRRAPLLGEVGDLGPSTGPRHSCDLALAFSLDRRPFCDPILIGDLGLSGDPALGPSWNRLPSCHACLPPFGSPMAVTRADTGATGHPCCQIAAIVRRRGGGRRGRGRGASAGAPAPPP